MMVKKNNKERVEEKFTELEKSESESKERLKFGCRKYFYAKWRVESYSLNRHGTYQRIIMDQTKAMHGSDPHVVLRIHRAIRSVDHTTRTGFCR